ncbi:MAG: amino acid ABC transporter substrate-binding protein [Solirubrobacterales bacterium]|nr:amino acid ABC transporter substrate-binding protein [Solirubrobacterales bacterium]
MSQLIERLRAGTRRMRAVVLPASLAVATALAIGACGSSSSSSSSSSSGGSVTNASNASASTHTSGSYVIGTSIPLTGPAAAYGASMQRGVLMAVDQINSSGGIDGKKLNAKFVDIQGDAAGGVQAYNQLVANHAFAVNTCFLAVSHAQAAQAQRTHVPVLGPCLGENSLLNLQWFYNVVPTVDQEIATLSQYAHAQGISDISVLVDQVNYPTTQSSYSSMWQKLGGKSAHVVIIGQGTSDPTPQITQALSNHPQALMVLAVGTLGQTIVQKLAAQGVSIPMYGNVAAGGYAQQIQSGKLNFAYTSGIYNYAAQWKAVKQKLYPSVTPELWDGSFYTSTMIAAQALKTAIQKGYGSDGAAVQKVLSDPSQSYTGCCGSFQFAAGHSAPGQFAVMHSSGGSPFKQVAKLSVASAG